MEKLHERAELVRALRGQSVTAQAESLGLARATLYDWKASEPQWWTIASDFDLFEILRSICPPLVVQGGEGYVRVTLCGAGLAHTTIQAETLSRALRLCAEAVLSERAA